MESELWKKGEIEESIKFLEESGCIYEKEGAKWFEAMRFGDEKDRVVIRKNGQYTYFAADIAYHWDKFKRGFNLILNTFGSDHHGYTKRIQGVASALGKDPNEIHCFLIQFAILYRAGEKVSMSTRKGTFVTLRELFEEVGVDAARFFYTMRRYDQHLDFDLDLAKSRSNENPVYYIQYAHARICSVFRQLSEKKLQWDQINGLKNCYKLDTLPEKALFRCLLRYQDTLKTAGEHFEPQILAHYLHELANYFHSYYNAYQFLVKDVDLRDARLSLILATRYVIVNGLKILGVNAPHEM
jgi:arginyl-tRNA synthetase